MCIVLNNNNNKFNLFNLSVVKQLGNSREFYTLPPSTKYCQYSTVRKAFCWYQDIMSSNKGKDCGNSDLKCTVTKDPLCFHPFDHKAARSFTIPSRGSVHIHTDIVPWCPACTTSLCHCLGTLVPGGELAQWCWQRPWIDHTTTRGCNVFSYPGLPQTGKETEQKQSSPSSVKPHNFGCETCFTEFGDYPLFFPSSTSLQYIGKQAQEFHSISIIYLQEKEHFKSNYWVTGQS